MAGNKYNAKNNTRTTADGRTIKFRSKLEAKWSRYLDLLVRCGEIKRYEYEPCYFEFLEVKFGIRRYMPDFRVIEKNGDVTWHELKGYLDPKSITKIRRFAKFYPDETLHLIFNGLPRARSVAKFATKQRIAIDKITPFVQRVVDASIIFKQLAIK